ncbi:MAG: hypothetical protein ACFE91_07485 [Promethearchaeota archaeon]
MTANKIHIKLDKLINSLTIKENQKTLLRKKTDDFYNGLKNVCQYQMPYWSDIYLSRESYQYTLERFWYGGSFDRGLFIKNRFDIDIYFIFKKENTYPPEQNHLTGSLLFELLYSYLKTYQYYYEMKLKLLKDPPYGHAIPIRIDHQNISILFDCIPAIENPNGYLVIPNGMGGIKKVNPNLEEQALSKLNEKQNGKITKLILLTKYWNFNWGKPLKGYLIERLVESIFDKTEVHTWDKAVKIFFSRAINILSKKKKLPDRVYTQYSILDEYSSDELESYVEILREATYYSQASEWNKLFHNI